MIDGVLYFAALAAIYAVLFPIRTAPIPALVSFAIFGGLLSFFRWGLWTVLAGSGEVSAIDLWTISLVDVALLGLPVVLLIHGSRAGRGTTLLDGLALGAFAGLGVACVDTMLGSRAEGVIAAWPPGHATLAVSQGEPVVWAGWMAFGAVIGLALILPRRFPAHRVPAWVVGGLLLLLATLEIGVGAGLLQASHGGAPPAVEGFAKAFFVIDVSGRLLGWVLILVTASAVVIEEWSTRRNLPDSVDLFLPRERFLPGFPGQFLIVLSSAVRGPQAVAAVGGFFRARRRLAVLAGGAARGVATGEELERVEELVADGLIRAESALAGRPVVSVDVDPGAPRWRQFLVGLALAMGGVVFFMLGVGWLGSQLGAAIGNEPRGYLYATAVAAGLGFAANHFRQEVSEGLRAFRERRRGRKEEKWASREPTAARKDVLPEGRAGLAPVANDEQSR